MIMKKFILLTFCMLNSLWALADFSGSGSGTASDPYIIVNPNQLNELRNFLNNTNVYFKMEDDIDLSRWITNNNPTQGWQPVGVSASPFKGHLDGNGKTIKNFMINRASNYVGFFGYITGADIKDLTIEGNVKGGQYTGGFAGYGNGSSKINNVHFVGNVTGGNNTGGLIGENKSNTLSNVSVKGNVKGDSTVGGILGYSEYSSCTGITYEGDIVATDHVGGVCGYNYANNSTRCSYTSCYAKGTINANDYVGGIIGIFPDYSPVDMNSCGAIMDITAHGYVGGLCGKMTGNGFFSFNSYINNCYAIGEIKATGDYIGGLIGYTKGYNIYINRNSYYYYEYITNNYFNGSVSGHNYVGGLVGWTYGAKVSKNYCAASVNGNKYVGGIVGYIDNAEAKFKSNVALNTSVNAVVSNVGRIYGYGSTNIGATIGSSDENRALVTTKVSANGIGLMVEDDMQNGTSFGQETFKLRATYQGLGWDFTNDWRSQETECYPYKPSQAAPPIILSGATSGSTTIHGKSYDGGTVYVTVGNKTYTTTCSGNLWDVTTDPQQAGELIRAYAVVEGLNQSYYTTQYVEYKGSGTAEDPYQIYTVEDLACLNGSYYYKLMNNLDLSTYISKNSPTEGWQPIGRNGAVMAHFDGGGHTISGLWCNSTKDYTGLFANASSNTICNLTVKVAAGKKVVGKDYTGILLGNNTNGTIENCSVAGDVEGANYTGGMVGRANGCTLTNASASGNVTGTVLVGGLVGEAANGTITYSNTNTNVSSTTANAYVGGLVGNNSAIVSVCTSKGSVSAEGTGSNAGGLIGKTTANVTNSMSASEVTMATEGVYMGGLVGTNYATVDKCYASGNLDGAKWAGGLVGENIGSNAYVKNSFACNHIVNVKDPQGYAERVIGGYKDGAATPEKTNYAYEDMQVSVNNVPMVVYDDIINGIAKTDRALKSGATYAVLGWDMTNTWAINEGASYPYLREGKATTPIDPSNPDNPYDDEDLPSYDDEPDTDISTLDNTIYVNNLEVNKTETVELIVNLKNSTMDISAFSFNLILPEGFAVTKVSRGERVKVKDDDEEFIFSFNSSDKDGVRYVQCYTMQDAVLGGKDGEVAKITISLPADVKAGKYPIIINHSEVAYSSTNEIHETVKSTLTVKDYIVGDANGDGIISITDVSTIASYLLGGSPAGFNAKAADANKDGTVSITDVSTLASQLLGK